MLNGILDDERKIFSEIFVKIRKRDFSGNSGQAIKNSGYQFSQNLIYKFGSLIFTIILARLLLPDKMGLYSLALSTIILLSFFSDLGIGEAILTFIPKLTGVGKKSKAKGYLVKLFKWKINLIFISSILILVAGFILSKFYYQKPIFYAILVGVIYQPAISLMNFIENLFKANENFKVPLKREIIFQVLRLIIVPLVLILFLNKPYNDEIFVAITLFALVISYFFSLLFLILKLKKTDFFKYEQEKLSVKEIIDLKKFIYPLASVALAGTFFGYIDMFMLGKYVSNSYIAYYSSAFSLVTGGAAIINFASIALMPIFAKRAGEFLKKTFTKVRNFVILISFLGAVFAYLISYYAIRYAYGVSYLPAVPVLQSFSVIILFLPLIGLYNNYFISQGRTKEVAWLLISSTILNIVFNIIGISYGLQNWGEIGAVYGALFATVLSRAIYLGGFLAFMKRR